MSHYFSEKQDSKLNLKKIMINLKKVSIELYSASGIFSKDELDKGTELLIENAIIKSNWEILDLGCGLGVVGISLKKIYPSIKVLMTDINERAVMISCKNIELHKLQNIEARKSDIFSSTPEKFDTILVNPPQTAGKKICFKIIEESFFHIKEGGLLQLVARHKKGGSSLSEKMEEIFGNVKDTAKKSGFRVYISERMP